MAKKAKAGTNGQTEIRGVDLAEVERLLGFMEKHGLRSSSTSTRVFVFG
jgi:hypothetical protein